MYNMSRPNAPEFAKNIKLLFMSQHAFVSESKNQEICSNDETIINENGIHVCFINNAKS